MSDGALFGAVVVVFALLVTTHVAVALALASRAPRVLGLVALVAFPLAPVLAARAGMKRRAGAWVALLVAYLILRFAARS
jgi:hypothetical protein